MTDFDATNLLDLAEAVAAGRMTATDAENRLRAALGGRPEGDIERQVRELRSLVRAAEAIGAHASATRGAFAVARTPAFNPSSARGDIPTLPVGGSVRRRPTEQAPRSGQRVAILLAATLAIGLGAVAATLIGRPQPAPNPAPSGLPVAVTSPTPEPTPSPIDSVAPTPRSQPIPSSTPTPTAAPPRVVVWHQSAPDKISVLLWQGRQQTSLVDIPLTSAPDPWAGSDVTRQLIANADASLFAISETNSQAQTRVRILDRAGRVAWSDTNRGLPDLAWSADGRALVVAFTPEPWTVVTVRADGSLAGNELSLPSGVPLKLLGFSGDGSHLLAYDGTGEAAPWEMPYSIDLASGKVSRLDHFAGGAKGIAVASTTTLSGWIDPVTGRVLDRGDMSGRETNWLLRRGSLKTRLGVPIATSKISTETLWTDDGSIVVLKTSLDDQPPSNQQKDPVIAVMSKPVSGATADDIGPVSWAFSGPKGARCRGHLLAARNGYVLVGLSAIPEIDTGGLGWDELNLTSLSGGAGNVLAFDGLRKFDVHFAGLID